jgi:hypothetical protein
MDKSQELVCALCSKAVDLTIDLSADESGKTVHEQCYVNRISTTDFAAVSRSRVG